MPLFIRDNGVDALAAELQKAIRAPSKKEAVRIALQHELDRARRAMPLADAMGAGDPGFDMKTYTDAMWGDD